MPKSNDIKKPPDARELTEMARRLVAEQNTLTLATAEGNTAWAAPVYYVFVKSIFYFLSGPDSRHITAALQNGQAAAAVHATASTWKEIKGLQMTGRVRVVKPGLEAVQVLRAYLKKYPFTTDFFKENISLDLDTFAKRFGVNLYGFIPTLVYYLDNQIRFAFREEVTL
ncbi:MAG: pyridoxamine 5'-phosphate oxidase family protein [Desulfobacteraceae bacterium]|jgi:uncharacterized protein YhbP (UPF0306 family)|nr:pyridoxamine 5'-phosphate oxidase family protein [Desulfobacteraceae bacterium]